MNKVFLHFRFDEENWFKILQISGLIFQQNWDQSGTLQQPNNESWKPQQRANAKWHEPMEVYHPV